MPIINSYPNDINVQDKDAWIGTDSYNRQTKQYTAEAVAKYLNVKGKVSIAGQVNYKFVDTPFDGSGTMAFAAGSGDGTPFSSITGFKISKSDLSGQQVTEYLDYLVGREIIIVDQNAANNFGHYSIYTYAINPNNDQYYDITISFIGGNGSISVDSFYSIANFTFGGAASTIATLTNIGIGNVNPSTYPTLKGLTTSYNNGTATIGLNIQDLPNTTIPTSASDILVPWAAEVSGVTYNSKATLQDLIDDTGVVGGPYLPLTGGTMTGNITLGTGSYDGKIFNGYGSSSSPSYSFRNDTGTGIYSPNPNTLSFSTNSVERLRVTSSGNIGIGTTSPEAKLTIKGDALTTAQPVRITNSVNDTHTGLFLNNTGATVGEKYGIQFGGYNQYSIGGIFGVLDSVSGNTSGDITFDFGNGTSVGSLVEKMRITHEGNLGIGTNSPGRTLDVVGRGRFVDSTGTVDILSSRYVPLIITNTSGYAHARINGFEVGGNTTATNEGYIKTADNSRRLALDTNGWLFKVASAEKMRLTPSGNLGIGTTSPSYGLDIHKSSNAFRVANSGGYEVFGVNPSAAIPTRIFGRAEAYASLVSSNSYETLNSLLVQGYKAGGNHLAIKTAAIRADYGTDYNSAGSSEYAAGVYSKFNSRSTGSGIDNIYGFYSTATNPSNTAVTNQYGLYIADTGVATNNYGVYQAGSSFKNIFEGNVGIGTTAPSSKLHIEDSISNGSLFKITTSASGSLQPVFDARVASNGDTYYDLNMYKSSTKKIQIKSANTSYIQQVDGTGGFDIKGHLKTSLQTVSGGGVLQLHRYGALSLNNDESYAHTPASALYINTLYNTSTDYLMLLANQGNDKLAVDLNGNVGIGTTSPSEKLHVNGTIISSGGGGSVTAFASNTSKAIINNVAGGGRLQLISDVGSIELRSKGGDSYITAGNLGIGTTAPSQKLEVSGNSLVTGTQFIGDTFTKIQQASGNLLFSNLSSSGGIEFRTNSTEKMRILSNGNVGIGTTSPSEKLEVDGDIIISDAGDRVFTTDALNGGFALGDIDALNDEAVVQGDGSSIFLKNAGNTTLTTDINNRVGIGTTSPASKLEVDGGDIEVDDSASGLILRSPDGTRYRVTVANGGTLTVTAV